MAPETMGPFADVQQRLIASSGFIPERYSRVRDSRSAHMMPTRDEGHDR
jgi:hypothetical protein